MQFKKKGSKKMEELVSIQWCNLTTAQMLYVHAVVMDELETVLHKHMNTIFELGSNPNYQVEREEKK